jgi:hypothetical protein
MIQVIHFVGNTIYMPTLVMILPVVLWQLPTRTEQPRSYLKILLCSLWYMTVSNVNESQLIYPIYLPVRITNAFVHGSGYPRIVELRIIT